MPLLENFAGLYDVIDKALLTKHFPAMLIFRAVLKGKTKKKFERAWQDYAADKNTQFSLYAEPPFPMPSLTRYHDGLQMPDEHIGEREKTRQLVIEKLEHILSFAKPI
jgi:hypothetical protein